MVTQRETVRLPEVKNAKIRAAAAQPIFDTGCRQMTLYEVQVLHDLVQFGCVACPPLRPELGAIS